MLAPPVKKPSVPFVEMTYRKAAILTMLRHATKPMKAIDIGRRLGIEDRVASARAGTMLKQLIDEGQVTCTVVNARVKLYAIVPNAPMPSIVVRPRGRPPVVAVKNRKIADLLKQLDGIEFPDDEPVK